jgi:hypothetical protein
LGAQQLNSGCRSWPGAAIERVMWVVKAAEKKDPFRLLYDGFGVWIQSVKSTAD